MLRTLAAALLALTLGSVVGCSSNSSHPATNPDPVSAMEPRVRQTLVDLAAFGNKHAGTDAGNKAGDYLVQRFTNAGLKNVHTESFTFPQFTLTSSALAVTVAGAPVAMAHDVFAYSGAGHAEADVVFVQTGQPDKYAGIDAKGKIVLVERDAIYHRQAQYEQVVAHGGIAMLYKSTSPQNLIQIGTVDSPEDGLALVPTVTVGSDDGQKLVDAIMAGTNVHAVIDVAASIQPATGRNVIGTLPGTDPSGAYLLLGAHYDTWYAGSVDNGTGVAATVALAEEIAKRVAGGESRRVGLVFIAYDAEELGLFGGYDYLRKHVVKGEGKMLGFLNFEIPANKNIQDGAQILARTAGPIDNALQATMLDTTYQFYVGMETIPAVLGGLIPTDIQGMYWWGLQGATTACNSVYYHTVQDTPDKVDTTFLAQSALDFEKAVDLLDKTDLSAFAAHDPQVWKPDVTTAPIGSGDLQVTVVARDASGAAQANALVSIWLDVDDFTRVFLHTTNADATGTASAVIPAAMLAKGGGSRWMHVTAGKTYPLSEVIKPL